MNKSSFTPKRIVLLITIAAAMFFALLALRNKLIVPFPLEIKYDTPTGGAMTENGDMLVVDSAGTRLVLGNQSFLGATIRVYRKKIAKAFSGQTVGLKNRD